MNRASEPSAEEAYPHPAPGPPDPHESETLRRLDDLERRLQDVQELAGRTYEQTQGWASLVASLRESPRYAEPFDAPRPLVSIPIATYAGAELLCDRALASIRRQTYDHWEAIVVGDHTTDDTAERIAALGDPRITFHNLPFRGPYPESDRGRWFIAGTRPANVALRRCTGDWIAPQDHDDSWTDDHLEVLLATARDERAELAYGRVEILDTQTGERQPGGEFPPRMGAFWFQAALYHRGLTAFEYDANARFVAEPGDWNRARRLWEAGVRFAFVDQTVTTYHFVERHREPSTTDRLFTELRAWAAELETGMEWWKAKATEAEANRADALADLEALRQHLREAT